MTTDTIAIWAEAWDPENGPIIGNTNKPTGLPWANDPADFKHFRAATRDRILVMGRKTFDILPAQLKTPQSLKERPIVVVTHEPTESYDMPFANGIEELNPAWSVWPDDLRTWLSFVSEAAGGKKVAVIGGSAIIELLEPAIDRLLVTRMRDPYYGDVRAPTTDFLQSFPFVATTAANDKFRVMEYTRTEGPLVNEKDCE